MDFFIPIVLFIIFFILFSICGYCCKRNKQGIVYGVANPQQITATTTAYNTANPPYPVMETPMPQPMTVPAPGFAHAAYPPAMPYPPTSGANEISAVYYPHINSFISLQAPYGYHPMPMPMMGGYQGNQPYPQMPMPTGGAYTSPVPPYPTQPMPQPVNTHQQQPPSYAEAVTQPVQTEVYAKQSPYNPNY